LESIIISNEGKENAEIRKGAYIIIERLLKNCFDQTYVDFLLRRAEYETDRDVLVSVLDALSDVKVTGDSNISGLIMLADHPAWQIRFAALRALGSFSTPESKTALYDFLERDRKKYKGEIVKYLDQNDDISYYSFYKILEELDYKVDKNGRVTWY
jgi:HEAT repeat protein